MCQISGFSVFWLEPIFLGRNFGLNTYNTKRIKETVDCLATHIEGLVVQSIFPHAGQKKEKADNLSNQLNSSTWMTIHMTLTEQHYIIWSQILPSSENLNPVACVKAHLLHVILNKLQKSSWKTAGIIVSLVLLMVICPYCFASHSYQRIFFPLLIKSLEWPTALAICPVFEVHASPQSVLKPTSSGICIIFLT